MRASVALARGGSRADNIGRALDLIADQIDLNGRERVLIKPNLVSTQRQLASTQVDAVRAVLDFVCARYTKQVLIAEGSAISPTAQGFDRFGYRELIDHYGVKLIDLNADSTLSVQVYDRHLRPITLRLARTILESDYRISVSPPKTHDTVIVTLSIKNMIMGSLVNPTVAVTAGGSHSPQRLNVGHVLKRMSHAPYFPQWVIPRLAFGEQSDKLAMHQNFPIINLNLAMLAPWVKPHLAIMDGFQAMEGAGPIDGDPVDWQIALAGTDALAVDCTTAQLMGFDPSQIGYLNYCRRMGLGIGEQAQIDILGEVPANTVRREFRPHPTYRQQRVWHLQQVESWLRPALLASA